MKFVSTDLPGVVIAEPQVFRDERGFLMETWHANKFADAGIHETFVQDNHTRSAYGVLRGMHVQLRHSQGKLVRVARGVIFDVAVDLRAHSTYFGKWTGHILSEENQRQQAVDSSSGFLKVSRMVFTSFLRSPTFFTSARTFIRLKMSAPYVGMIPTSTSAGLYRAGSLRCCPPRTPKD